MYFNHPGLGLVVSAVLGIALAFTLMLVSLLWARVRSFPAEETTRRVNDLAMRQRSIEALLMKLEPNRDGATGTAPRAATAKPTAPGGSPGRPQRGERADRPAAQAGKGPTLITIPHLPAPTSDVSGLAAAELGRRFGAIWALADAGESTEAIARETAQPIGQVELILGLRRQLTSHSGGRA
jgi:hypothetical protein